MAAKDEKEIEEDEAKEICEIFRPNSKKWLTSLTISRFCHMVNKYFDTKNRNLLCFYWADGIPRAYFDPNNPMSEVEIVTDLITIISTGKHWVTAYIDRMGRNMYIFDSLGEGGKRKMTYAQMKAPKSIFLNDEISRRNTRFIFNGEKWPDAYKVWIIPYKWQKDSWNCGVYSCWLATWLIEHLDDYRMKNWKIPQDIPFNAREIDPNCTRTNLALSLCVYSLTPGFIRGRKI